MNTDNFVSGTHLMCISLWRSSAGPSLQALNLMATIGYTLSPLVVKPLLSSTPPPDNTTTTPPPTLAFNPTPDPLQRPYNVIGNVNNKVVVRRDWDNSTYTNSSLISQPAFYTNIQYAFLITALYDLIVSIGLFIIFFMDGHNLKLPEEEKEENLEKKPTKSSRPRFVLTVSVLFFIFNVFYGGIEVGYAGLLMTFAVKYLGWSKQDGTNVTAVLQV